MSNRVDIIVFGASGFTGKFVLPQVYKLGKVAGRALTWGVSGRSQEKLKNVLGATAKQIGVNDLSDVPIIIADATNEESVRKMTARAKIIINCCGPFDLLGEVVVKSCIETGTHHLDISAETQFIERMELKYKRAAEEKGVYIISACGLESIPMDLGLIFLEKQFEGTLNSLDSYLYVHEKGGGLPSPAGHFSTVESVVNALASYREIISQRRKLCPKLLPNFQPRRSLRNPLQKIGNKWALPFPITDHSIVQRSQRYFCEHDKKRPVQAKAYVLIDSFLIALMIMIIFPIGFAIMQFTYGRKLILKYPKFFTAGYFSHEGPSEESMNQTHFSVDLHGKGWSGKSEEEYQCTMAPNKAIIGRVSGINPGYGFTSLAVSLCAIVVLTEPRKLPAKGGVYTTAVAFSKTSLIKQLQENGVAFEIISVADL